MDDGHTRPVLQLTVTETQPVAQHTHSISIPSCKPMQLRPRQCLGKQEGKVRGKSEETGVKMAWSYDRIMECCGRF